MSPKLKAAFHLHDSVSNCNHAKTGGVSMTERGPVYKLCQEGVRRLATTNIESALIALHNIMKQRR